MVTTDNESTEQYREELAIKKIFCLGFRRRSTNRNDENVERQ